MSRFLQLSERLSILSCYGGSQRKWTIPNVLNRLVCLVLADFFVSLFFTGLGKKGCGWGFAMLEDLMS